MEGPGKIEEEFNVGELSAEIMKEWHAEKATIKEEEKKQKLEIKKENAISLSSDVFSVSETEKELSELEKKKELIKNEIKSLLNMVVGEKGLADATDKAKKSDNPFILDVFHDILAKDENYKKLLNNDK